MPFHLLNYPLIVFALSLLVLWLAAWTGRSLRQRRPIEEAEREDFGVILAANLTLLALIIGFTFSMAISRYDQRKVYEEAEANAIGTEYFRADVLPPGDAIRVRELLKKYVGQRILFYQIRDETQRSQINAYTAQLQAELWSTVRAPASAQPTPVLGLALAGMNDVLNSQGYTQAAWWNRIPVAAWALMAIIGICCNILIGYGMRLAKGRNILLLVLPLVISISFLLIADVDSPRGGIIRVIPQNLMSFSQSLH